MTSRIVVGRQSGTTNRRMAQNCVTTKSVLHFLQFCAVEGLYKTKINYKKSKKNHKTFPTESTLRNKMTVDYATSTADSAAQGWASECPDVKNYKWRLKPVWHIDLCFIAVPIGNSGVKGLIVSSYVVVRRRLCSRRRHMSVVISS